MSLKKLDFDRWDDGVAPKGEAVEIEVSLESFREGQAHQELIDASIKILSHLKAKRRLHNADREEKISLNDLKKIFLDSEDTYASTDELDLNTWGFAFLNARLKNLGEEIAPNEEDIKLARNEIKACNISIKLNSLEELYIEIANKLNFNFLYQKEDFKCNF